MKRLFFLYLTCCMLLTAMAQKTVLHHFTIADGLSDNSALCALRDGYGLLWVGTENGLNYFDGYRVHPYRDVLTRANSGATNTIMSLFEHNRNIWIGGMAGVYVYDRLQNRYYRFNKRTNYGVVISSAVSHIFETDNQLVWFLTHGQGIFIYDYKKDRLWQDSRHGSFFTDAVVGADGLVYAVTLNRVLKVFRANGQFVRQYNLPDSSFDKNTVSITSSPSGLWLGCNTSLLRLESNGIRLQVNNPLLGSIHSLVSDRQGNLYIGSDNGVSCYIPSTGKMVPVSQTKGGRMILTDDMVNHLQWDADSTLLVLTRMGGVNMLRPQKYHFLFIPLPEEPFLAGRNLVRALCSGPHGELWIGTDQGLYYGDNQQQIVHYAANRLPYEITSLMMDNGDLWIGTRHHGIRVLNIKTGNITAYTYSSDIPYTLPTNEVNSIFRTSQGEIYVLTNWGLNRFDRSNGHFYGYASISAMTSFVCMQESEDHWLWAASSNRGLYCKRTGNSSFDKFDSKAIGQQTVVVMHKDGQGDFWVATNGGGLYRYNSQQGDFERYDQEGTILYNQSISFIEEDQQHALWLGTPIGIVRISPSHDLQDLQVYGYVHDFDVTQAQRSSCVYGNGNVFFGGNGGVYRFTFEQMSPEADLQHVYVDAISFPFADNSDAELQQLGLDVPLYTRRQIELPYSNNSFTLHFASARYSGMPEVQYEYMLEGFDRSWSYGTAAPEATYANLPPGTYTFLLRRAGQTDSTKVVRLGITILPPWYRTWIAYLIYILLLVAFLGYVYYHTQRRLKRRCQRQVEASLQEQEKQVFQSKIRFFVDLVHEIRTPLTLMSLPLEQMESNEYTVAIRRNMNYLLGITNQLLDFQKQENGGITLVCSSTDIGQMLQQLYDQFISAATIQGKRLQLQVPDDACIFSIDRDKMQKVMMNLVGNALKYAHTEIIIRLTTDNNYLSIAVIDDGPGVPYEERDRIFDRYYQIGKDSKAASLGTGLGLAYAKMVAEAHHGDLKYMESPGGGACFMVTLKCEASKNAKEELSSMVTNSESTVDIDSSQETSHVSHGKFRILLVEDNEELLKVTSESLRQWYKVTRAYDGIDALEVLKYQEVDVVVSDVMMPRMDGTELCRCLKQDINTSHLPVILLTAKVAVDAKVEGMESGADIYMEKPFSIKQLHLQIENLMRLRQRFYERLRSIDGFNHVEESTSKSLGLNQQDIQFVERLQKFVEENMLDEEFSIDALAEQLCMSRSSFYRKIKALTGLAPNDYLKTARMNQAAKLLREGLRPSEVGKRVGFSSSSYFAKCFRAQFGCLPKDYTTGQNSEGSAV